DPFLEKEGKKDLLGKAAIANAKLAYGIFKREFASPRWKALEKAGARPQRLLWASTGTKNPAYSDVLYVDELIGADTINTMPIKTIDAFRDHGRVRESLTEDVPAAAQSLDALESAGISLAEITADLVVDGVRLFSDAFDKLLAPLAAKRRQFLGAALDSQAVALEKSLKVEVDKLA